eukprot:CAMPEP_0202444502 /NCGR_PEP_ID=MMETSP1360-20130828/3560_1 /ASSEMBLY_ACC=CAM_ASM_000848 /TAXON_ID=515479 /ORGANISM="Licmophora paradoxa, Strain CCMP2313" /LENGTH=198 /DNA_ID=CAMNT_0049060519 /DNA_START=9 /DNA_END=605 /DNA_ORIENTATION=-
MFLKLPHHRFCFFFFLFFIYYNHRPSLAEEILLLDDDDDDNSTAVCDGITVPFEVEVNFINTRADRCSPTELKEIASIIAHAVDYHLVTTNENVTDSITDVCKTPEVYGRRTRMRRHLQYGGFVYRGTGTCQYCGYDNTDQRNRNRLLKDKDKGITMDIKDVIKLALKSREILCIPSPFVEATISETTIPTLLVCPEE